MKRVIFFLIIVFFFGSCRPKNHYSNIKQSHADVEAIRTWIKNYIEAINTADLERILTYESEDICYYPPNQPSFSGK